MGAIASQITILTIIYSTVYSDAGQRKHQSSASLAFLRGIHRWPVNSPHKRQVTRKMFSFDDVIMENLICGSETHLNIETIFPGIGISDIKRRPCLPSFHNLIGWLGSFIPRDVTWLARDIAFPYHRLATIAPHLSETREQHQPMSWRC